MDTNGYILRRRKTGDCFRLLSACFYSPRKKLYLEENLFTNLSMLIEAVCPAATIFAAQMERAIQKYSNEDLTVEYAKLFVGPYELKAPPYGSVYLDPGRKVMGDSTMRVARIYVEMRLSIDDDFKAPPDHISAELEFMYYLIHKEVEALEKSEADEALALKETQKVFLDEFLRRWIPPFCAKIKEGTDNEFYGALADCLSSFIDQSDR